MSFRSYRASSFNFSQYRGNGGGRVLQRRCACGNRAESGGECSQCAEREGVLQRKPRSGGPPEAPSIVHDVLRAPGQPLDSESQNLMEARFGYDFSGVRVHADEQAQRSAEATNADAYTVGQDIVFASGRYAPETPAGKQLLAHELTHVVQQGSTRSSGPIAMGKTDEHEIAADHTASEIVSGEESVSAINRASASLQRQETAPGETTAAPATAPAPAEGPCLEEVVGEDIPSLLQAGVVTVLEFGAEWCNPCKDNKEALEAICQAFKINPPPVTVRFYSIDIEAAGNEEVSKAYTPGGSIPHLYFYVGSSMKSHYNSGISMEGMERIVAEHVEYANTSGAARGAKTGLGWGALAGTAAGIAGAVAIGTQSNLEGNALIGAIMGTIAGGAALGVGLGAAIGAIAGAVGDDRDTGPKQQKRKKLQKQSRSGSSNDREEREADQMASQVAAAGRQRRPEPSLPLSRGEQTAIGAGIGAGGGAALGAGIGLIVASQMADTPYGAAAGIGAAIGGGIGLIAGLLAGLFTRNTTPETIPEADALIRRRYGHYLRDGSAGPLHNATVHVVSQAELCERAACRRGTEVDTSCGLLGWTDSGVPLQPSKGPGNQPAPITRPEDEPTCRGWQLEHATPDRPVIYYLRNAPGTLIHEGLHAVSHPDFGFLHNHVNEGTTEYFTRGLQDEINMPHSGSYEREVASVEKLVNLIGEEPLAQGYFSGRMPELHQTVNSQLGDCALIMWAFNLQMNSDRRADQILESRHVNYCGSQELHTVTPGELTPAPQSQTEQQEQSR